MTAIREMVKTPANGQTFTTLIGAVPVAWIMASLPRRVPVLAGRRRTFVHHDPGQAASPTQTAARCRPMWSMRARVGVPPGVILVNAQSMAGIEMLSEHLAASRIRGRQHNCGERSDGSAPRVFARLASEPGCSVYPRQPDRLAPLYAGAAAPAGGRAGLAGSRSGPAAQRIAAAAQGATASAFASH